MIYTNVSNYSPICKLSQIVLQPGGIWTRIPAVTGLLCLLHGLWQTENMIYYGFLSIMRLFLPFSHTVVREKSCSLNPNQAELVLINALFAQSVSSGWQLSLVTFSIFWRWIEHYSMTLYTFWDILYIVEPLFKLLQNLILDLSWVISGHADSVRLCFLWCIGRCRC